MPAGNTIRAMDPSGSAKVIPLTTGTGQSITVTTAKTDLSPDTSGITIQTIQSGLRGRIRITNTGTNSLTLVDNTGNLDLQGGNRALTQNAYIELERTGTSGRWKMVELIPSA